MREEKNSLVFENIARWVLKHKIDTLFFIFMSILIASYYFYISAMAVPIWDGAVYLENARNWIRGERIFEPYRPQLISWITDIIWFVIGGENWEPIKYLQDSFIIGAGIILYFVLRKHKGSLFAFGVVTLTMLNTVIFYNSAHILTEGIALFFLVLSLYFFKSEKPKMWPLGGLSLALTFASRYPIIVQAFTILIVETIIQRNRNIFVRAMIGGVPIIFIVVVVIFLKSGGFGVALAQDTHLTSALSPFYVANAISIWGFAIILVPVAFVFRRTYQDKYNYTFIAWFLVALLFWSANATNHDERFAYQFTPAVYYLAILAIENIVKSKLSILQLKTKV